MHIGKLAIYILAILFAALLATAVSTREVHAGLGCWQLRNCSGDGGCNSGSVEGCTIICNGGGTIVCIGG